MAQVAQPSIIFLNATDTVDPPIITGVSPKALPFPSA
jgi:hypothetical protein